MYHCFLNFRSSPRTKHGCKGETGGSVKCGPEGAKHHAVGCPVQMGCQLLLPADPKK